VNKIASLNASCPIQCLLKVNVLSQKILIGKITNYRVGNKTQQPKECLIEFANMGLGAGQLIGKKVSWNNGKLKTVGKIIGLHGRGGIVKVRFRTPVPGQAIGTDVQVLL
jgi:ribosomal protein L35AE/L33A